MQIGNEKVRMRKFLSNHQKKLWATLLFMLLLPACSPYVSDEFSPQKTYPDKVGGKHSVGQTFVAYHDGLNTIDVLLAHDESTDVESLSLHLRTSPESTSDLRTATLDASQIIPDSHNRFSFEPVFHSTGQRYYFEISAPTAATAQSIMARSNHLDSYPDGALYLDNQAQDGQLVFRLGFNRAYRIAGSTWYLVRGIPIALAGIALFVLPGLALLVWLLPRRTMGIATTLIAATGVSVALTPLVLLASQLIGWRWGPSSTWIALVLCAAFVAKRWRPRKATGSINMLCLVVSLAAILTVRLLVIRPYTIPLWGDSVQHTVITQMFIDHGGLTHSWAPYAPFHSLTVHYGFHAIAAFFQWVTGLPAPQAVLIVGQIINALAVFTLYPLAMRISNGRRWVGIFAVLIAGMLIPVPMDYVNWGRYPQLAGQMILPVALWLLWELSIAPKHGAWRIALLAAIAASGMALTYYRMPFYYAAFLPAWFLGFIVPKWRSNRERWSHLVGRLLLTGIFFGIALGAWIPRLLSGNLGQSVVSNLGSTRPFDTVLELYRTWLKLGVLNNYIPSYLIGLTAISIIWRLVKRRWNAAIIAGWLFSLLGLVALRLTPLAGVALLDFFAIFIALYLPVALLVAELGNDLLRWLGHQNTKLGQWASIGMCLGIIAFGGGRQLERLDANYVLVTQADLAAMDWIRDHTRPDAKFLVNGFTIYDGRSVVGSDAGWWIPFLAGRQNTIPPQYALLNELPDDPNYLQQTVNLVSQLDQTPPTTKEGLKLLCEQGIDHVYIGQGQGRVASQELDPYLVPSELLASSAYDLLYHQDQVWVFALASQACQSMQDN